MRGRRAVRDDGRRTATLALAACIVAGLTLTARAEPPALSGEPPADKVLAVLDTYCASCHQIGHTAGHGSVAKFGNVLNLGEIARDPSLVVPGAPDASPLYQRMLSRHRPESTIATKAPAAAEIEAVRDWIEGLDVPPCTVPIATRSSQSALLDAWRKNVGQRATRFISLLPLFETCQTGATLADARKALEIILTNLPTPAASEPHHFDTVGEASAILAINLPDEVWLRATDGAPAFAGGVPGDWLAAHFLSANSAPLDVTSKAAVQTLARSWERAVDLRRAASELSVEPKDLAQSLLSVETDELKPSARQLLSGTVPRKAWQRLSAHLRGEAPPQPLNPASAHIDLALYTDKPTFAAGELLTIKVRTSKACHLTLINIDRSGNARVLYPNEMEQDNLIAPSVTVPIPSPTAGYQLRLDDKGQEHFVAVCQRTTRNLEGVSYDYERQRFALLGPWRDFLKTAPERETEARRVEAERQQRQSRRRRHEAPLPAELPAIDPTGPDIEGRATLTITVE